MGKRACEQWNGDEADQVRVLLECPPAASPSMIASLIERNGYAVRSCEGPTTRSCELLDHGSCALVDGAGVGVNMLGSSRREREGLDAVSDLRRAPAIVVETRNAPIGEPDPALGAGPGHITALPAPATKESLLGAIREALEHQHERVAWWGDGFC